MVWRSTRDLRSVGQWRVSPLGWYMEVPMPWWASWSSEEHRVSYSLPQVRWVIGVLKPCVLVDQDISSTGVRVLVSCSAGFSEVTVLGRDRNISGTRCCRCLRLPVLWRCHALGCIDAAALVPQRSSKPAGKTSVSGSQNLPWDWGQLWEDWCGSGEHWRYHAVRVDMLNEDRASLCNVQVTNVEGWMISVLCSLWVKG